MAPSIRPVLKKLLMENLIWKLKIYNQKNSGQYPEKLEL
jgi:hypothetical protein